MRAFKYFIPFIVLIAICSNANSQQTDSLRYLKFAQEVVERYDLDKDGSLNADEFSRFRRPPANADADRDGFVTAEELAKAYEVAATGRSIRSESLGGVLTNIPAGDLATLLGNRAALPGVPLELQVLVVRIEDEVPSAETLESLTFESAGKLAATSPGTSIDRFKLTIPSGTQSELRSHRTVGIPTAVTVRNEKATSYRNSQAGVEIQLKPVWKEGTIEVVLEVGKTELMQPLSEVLDSKPDFFGLGDTVSVSLSTTVTFSNGKAATIVMENDEKWLIVVSGRKK
ncbi:MAG: hypothetical protein R3C03_04715 [Pirellulaceae bacterium]